MLDNAAKWAPRHQSPCWFGRKTSACICGVSRMMAPLCRTLRPCQQRRVQLDEQVPGHRSDWRWCDLRPATTARLLCRAPGGAQLGLGLVGGVRGALHLRAAILLSL
jgi:hypothetical protein